MDRKEKYEIHVVPHTHWDREWYLPFERFRVILIEMIDYLLDVLDNKPEFKFMLDGQTVILEDYLKIRPEEEGRLKGHIKEGRILIGPWYTMPDECLVSGEALVRNLLLGHKIAQGFGPVMKVGYLPDIFGHISQMPQILRGFNIDSFVAFRGIESEKTEFWWKGPDGSRVLSILMPEGYCNFHTFPEEPQELIREINKTKKKLISLAMTSYLLFMNGCDHLGPQSSLPQMIKKVNRQLKGERLILSTIPEYIRRVKRGNPKLETYCGELRKPIYRYVHSSGVLATRIYLKQKNEEVQTLLERWAEPFAAFAWGLGEGYPSSFLWQAWRYLLQNQAHDSICGCVPDLVSQEIMIRFLKSGYIADEIAQRGLRAIARKVDTSYLEEEERCIVVFNPLNWKRTEIINLDIDFPFQEKRARFLNLSDTEGRDISYQTKYAGKRSKSSLPQVVPRRIGQRSIVDTWNISLLAENIPSDGYKIYIVKPVFETKRIKIGDTNLVVKPNVLENRYLRVLIKKNGALTIRDKETGNIYHNCNLLEDGGDAGDLFDYSPPRKDKIITTSTQKAAISLVNEGPVMGTSKIKIRLDLPRGLSGDRKARDTKLVRCEAISLISLGVNSKRIDIVTEIDNRAKDHRIRVLFPLGTRINFSYAGGHYEVVRRRVKAPSDAVGGEWEKPMGLHPQENFIDVNDGKKGLTVVSRGLPQYEVKDDEKGTIALTLIRSVGWFRQNDLLTVKRDKGEVAIPTPEAQCLGRYTFQYSIIPHSGTWKSAKTYKQAYQYKAPLKAITTERHSGSLPQEMSFISIKPDTLIVTAVKKAEYRNSLIVRCYNITGQEVVGKVVAYQSLKEVRLVTLDEKIIRKLKIRGTNSVSIKVGKHKIVNIEIIFL